MPLLIALLVLYVLALIATSLYALARGGRTERRAIIALLIAVAGTQAASGFRANWLAPEYGIMAVDAALFVAFVVIAHHSERFWPIWIAAAQLVGFLTHLAVIVHPNVLTELYRLTQPFWAFPILAGIAWGTWTRPRTS